MQNVENQLITDDDLTDNISKVAILVATGFEEAPVVYCLDRLRGAGHRVLLISQSAGLVSGLHGLFLRPDKSLDQVRDPKNFRLIIVPGSRQCTAALLSDPRVYELFDSALENEGFVAAVGSASVLLDQVNLARESGRRYFAQRDADLPSFAGRLLDLMLGL